VGIRPPTLKVSEMGSDDPVQPAPTPAIKDVNIQVALARDADGRLFPVLQISIALDPDQAGQVGVDIASMIGQAAAAAQAENRTSLVLPDTVGKLFLPVPPNGHKPGS
jgi:hypothetical protein